MSEELSQSSLAPVDTGVPSLNANDSREALMAWLTRPRESLVDNLRDLSADQMTTLLDHIGQVLRQQEAKFTCMQEISSALGQTIRLDELLELIMEKITRLMEAERSTLFLVDPDTGDLWSKVTQGMVNTELRLKEGEGIAGWVAATGKSINVRDAYNDPRFSPAVDDQTGFRTRTMLCQPIRNQEGNMIGVVQVLNRNSGHFTAQDENLLSAIASQTAVAIENSKLYLSVVEKNFELLEIKEKLEKKVAELDLLYEIEREVNQAIDLDELVRSITEKTLELISARACALTLKEDGHHRMCVLVDRTEDMAQRDWDFFTRMLPDGQGIASQVMRSGKAFRCNMESCEQVPEAPSEALGMPVQNIISVPLFDEDEPIGALEVVNGDVGEDGEGFSDDDEKLLTLIAGQIAGTVAARRHREEQEKAKRLAAIGQMLSGVLHDLKNPIAIISGNVQLMARSDDRERREEFAQDIKKHFRHLNQMTHELLTFARGDTEVQLQEVDLDELFEELDYLLSTELADSGVELSVEVDYDGKALVDPVKIKRAVLNLARNAAEAMADENTDGHAGAFAVRVSRDTASGELVITCQDDGPGIPDAIRNTLFEPFVTRGKTHGTGLGLAIVKKIVEEHRGRITVDSAPGRGTTFTLRIPQPG